MPVVDSGSASAPLLGSARIFLISVGDGTYLRCSKAMALRLFVSEHLVFVSVTIRLRPCCYGECQLAITTAHASPATGRLYKGARAWSLLNEVTGR